MGADDPREARTGSWLRRGARVAGVVLGVLLLVLAGTLFFVTQTGEGRDLVGSRVEDAIDGTIAGRFELGSITGGNLLDRAAVSSIDIRTADGDPFLHLEDVQLQYDPLGLLRGRYEFRSVTAGRVELLLEQAEDGRWNFDRIFADPGSTEEQPEGEDEGGTRIAFADLRVESGWLEVRTPLDDAEDPIWNTGSAREGGGTVRVVRLDSLRGEVPRLVVADPERPISFRLQEVSGELAAVRQPLRLHGFTGGAVLDDTARVELEDVRVGSSRVRGSGLVSSAEGTPFEFELEADSLAFADLAWLPLPVPASGGGTGDLVLRSDGDVTSVAVSRGDFAVGGSRVSGGFDLALEESPRFRSFDLRFDPLELSLLEELLERPLEPSGSVTGELRGRGTLDLLGLDGELALHPAGAGPGVAPGAGEAPSDSPAAAPDAASRLSLRGGLGMVEPYRMRSLHLEMEAFEPRWLRILELDTRQAGRVTGTAELDGRPGGRISFTADIRHTQPEVADSHVRGEGSVDLARGRELDVELSASPLALSVLAPYVDGVDQAGTVSGPFSASGTLSDLRARADLETPRGQLRFDGRFDLESERTTYDAVLTARDIQLAQWMSGAPETRLAVRGSVRGEGTDPETLSAAFDLQVLPSTVDGVRVDSSVLRFTVDEGLATVDTFTVGSEIGSARGQGSAGLARDRSGALVLDMEIADLATWNRWLVERESALVSRVVEDLFTQFPELPANGMDGGDEEIELAAPDSLSGSLVARGVVYGNPWDMALGGRVEAREPAYGSASADSVQLTLDVTAARSLDSLLVRGTAWAPAYGDARADSLFLRFQRLGPRRADVEVDVARDTAVSLRAAARLDWGESRKMARVRRFGLDLGSRSLQLVDTARVEYGEEGLRVDDLVMEASGGGRVLVDGAIPAEGPADFRVSLDDLPLSNLAFLLDPPPPVQGSLTAGLRIGGTAGDPVMEGSLAIERPRVDPVQFRRLHGDVTYREGLLRADFALEGRSDFAARAEAEWTVDLAFRRVEDRFGSSSVEARLVADSLPLKPAELRWPQLHDVRGFARGEVRAQGPPGALSFDGNLTVSGGGAGLAALGVRLEEIGGEVAFRDAGAVLDSLTLTSSAGGRGVVTGTVGLENPATPSFDLELRMDGLRAMDRSRARARVDGTARLGGDYDSPSLTGDLRLSDGTIQLEEFQRERDVVDLADPELYALLDTASVEERRAVERARNPFLQNLRADLVVSVGPDLWLRSRDLDVAVAGTAEVRLDRAQEDVRVIGTLNLVRGSYRYELSQYYRRQLRIVDGRVEFVGTPGMDPNLLITAEHRTRTERGLLVIRAEVTGTLRNPTLALTSDPPLAESDRICVLLFNTPCAASAGRLPGPLAQGQVQQLAREQLLGQVGTQLSSLLAGGGGPDYVDFRSASGAGRDGVGASDAESPLLAGTEVEVGWYVSPDVFLTVSQPLGNFLPTASLLWRFAGGWSVEGRWDYRFAPGLTGVRSSNIDANRSVGLFLFRQWSF